jgi:hypothetical protein
MLTQVFICILAAVILFGNIAHFRAMAILAQYGIRVRYYASLSDLLYMHRTYMTLARQNGLPSWPIYGIYVGITGIIVGGILIILNFLFHL